MDTNYLKTAEHEWHEFFCYLKNLQAGAMAALFAAM